MEEWVSMSSIASMSGYPKRFHRAKKQGNPRIDVSQMSQPNITLQFAEAFQREYGAPQPNDSATEKLEIIRDAMHRIALATFGEKPLKDSRLV